MGNEERRARARTPAASQLTEGRKLNGSRRRPIGKIAVLLLRVKYIQLLRNRDAPDLADVNPV